MNWYPIQRNRPFGTAIPRTLSSCKPRLFVELCTIDNISPEEEPETTPYPGDVQWDLSPLPRDRSYLPPPPPPSLNGTFEKGPRKPYGSPRYHPRYDDPDQYRNQYEKERYHPPGAQKKQGKGKKKVRLLLFGSIFTAIMIILITIFSVIAFLGETDPPEGNPNELPVAVIDLAEADNPEANKEITFDGSGSRDDGSIVQYTWDFGDWTLLGFDQIATHKYECAGNYDVTLTVYDDEGGESTVTRTIQVGFNPNATKYAVVIGISLYDNDDDLYHAHIDASDWAQYLSRQDYCVYKLIDQDATKDEIKRVVRLTEKHEEEGDYVAFIWNGHGTYSQGHSFLCPTDSDDYPKTWIKDTELRDWFSDFESDHIFFFFGSCCSGGMDEVAGPGRYVSQACGEQELTIDSSDDENMVWTMYFLKNGLEEMGNIGLETIFQSVYQDAYDHSLEIVKKYPEGLEDYVASYPEEEDGDPGQLFIL